MRTNLATPRSIMMSPPATKVHSSSCCHASVVETRAVSGHCGHVGHTIRAEKRDAVDCQSVELAASHPCARTMPIAPSRTAVSISSSEPVSRCRPQEVAD